MRQDARGMFAASAGGRVNGGDPACFPCVTRREAENSWLVLAGASCILFKLKVHGRAAGCPLQALATSQGGTLASPGPSCKCTAYAALRTAVFQKPGSKPSSSRKTGVVLTVTAKPRRSHRDNRCHSPFRLNRQLPPVTHVLMPILIAALPLNSWMASTRKRLPSKKASMPSRT